MTPIDPKQVTDLIPFVDGYHVTVLPRRPVEDYRQLEWHLQDIAGPFVAVMELYDSQGNWQPHLHVITSAVPPIPVSCKTSAVRICDKVHADNLHAYLRKQRSSLYYSSSTEEVRAEVVEVDEEEPVLGPLRDIGEVIPVLVVFHPYMNRESPIMDERKGIVFLFYISVRPP